MNLLIKRSTPIGKPRTFGVLYIDDIKICNTLEDTVREKQGVSVLKWKIAGKTAIPSGKYKITLENSPKFGPDTITLHNVEGFSYIRMHSGNTEKDTEGCILLGMDVSMSGLVNSRAAVSIVKGRIAEALNKKQPVFVTIQNFSL